MTISGMRRACAPVEASKAPEAAIKVRLSIIDQVPLLEDAIADWDAGQPREPVFPHESCTRQLLMNCCDAKSANELIEFKPLSDAAANDMASPNPNHTLEIPVQNRRVVVTQRFFDDAAIAFLNAHDCIVEEADLPVGQADGNLTHDELVAMLRDAAGWIVGHARVTRALQAALPELRVISRRGVGYERVDLDAARELGKVVCIAAGGNDASVADHAIALMLAVGHRFRETQQRMISGDWSILMGSDLYQKTVGVIGFGRIGRSLVQRLKGFDAEILVATPNRSSDVDAEAGVEFVNLEELLTRSDYVSLHAPLTAATRYIIDERRLSLMKPTSILINTARGGLVDDKALLDALKAKTIAGAGLDVFLSEADPTFKAVTQELIELSNVIATPHAGASTREGLDRTNMVAAACVVAVLDGDAPPRQCVVADGRTASSIT